MGAPRPVFAHLPTVLGPDGKKLSKRAGSAGVAELRARGYLPDAVVNYLSLLGWSPGEDREVLERSVLVAELSLDRVGASDTVFDPEKLRWMSGQHLALLPLEAVVEAVRPFLDADRFPQALSRLPLVIAAIRTRLEILSDVNGAVELLYPGEPALREGAREAGEEAPGAARALLGGLRDALAAVNPWDAEVLARTVREAGKALGARGPALFHPFRLALCGARSGPTWASCWRRWDGRRRCAGWTPQATRCPGLTAVADPGYVDGLHRDDPMVAVRCLHEAPRAREGLLERSQGG
jgi:glutamyl/glutaminyl-tRNA synthetase